MKRLPAIFGAIAALAAFLIVAPVAVAVALLRSSSDAAGPSLAAQILITVLVIFIVAAAGLGGWALTRFILRFLGKDRK